MIRTEFQKSYLTRIEALNDQLWYFLFTSQELNKKLSTLSVSEKERFTTDVFDDNHFSSRIHVKAKNLTLHQDKNKQLTFGSYFSTSYEIVSNYIKEVFDKLKNINHITNYSWNRNKEPEGNMELLFTNNGLTFTPDYILKTLSYLRYRRNHFTHIISPPNPVFIAFINTNGIALNTKWRTSGVVSIDFTALSDFSSFEQDETIELLKLLRICLIDLDHFIGSILDKNELINSIVKAEFGTLRTRKNSIVIDQRVKKIVNIAKEKFGFVVTENEAEQFVRIIGFK